MVRDLLIKIVLICILSNVLNSNASLTLTQYVDQCKSALGVTSIPKFDCKGTLFRDFDSSNQDLDFLESNDYVAHKTINSNVDAVFACRWVGRGNSAVSGEMILHNRVNGKTCFFELKRNNDFVGTIETTNPSSPTESDAASFWEDPSKITKCTSCHSAGPYIASPQIASALAKFGLLNDNHDMFATIYTAVEPAAGFNDEIYGHSQFNSCAASCHVVNPLKNTLSTDGTKEIDAYILPSMRLVIDDSYQHMPPTSATNDYRWLNRDNAGSTGDYERVSDFVADEKAGKKTIPDFYCNGKTPKYLEAHEVDKSTIYKFDDNGMIGFQKLYKFNLQDGLICRDRDQPSGIHKNCSNYYTRYKCDGVWTDWQSNDTVADGIEDESRSKFKNLCASPSAIQARYRAPTTEEIYVTHDGPRDRLAQADNIGLKCLNSDQSNGSCKNYVVRFTCE